MGPAILLAFAASVCTATASVCQRRGAITTEVTGFDTRLILRLVHRPVWLAGIAAMILGFGFQLTALRFGPLALVQPMLALELLFVFGYMTAVGSRIRVQRRDWLAAAAMSAGLALFLGVSAPSDGRRHAPGGSWWLAGLITATVVLAIVFLALAPGRITRSRRAALLGVATGVAWGFEAAVIKEFSSHVGDGLNAILASWSLYVLIGAGALAMLLASHAMAAGPLAASQPGFTILDPLAASFLGLFLFREHIRTGLPDLAGEAAALALLIAGASVLSHSHLVTGEVNPEPSTVRPTHPYARL
ncbi:MAG TPA: DMT family transporter [Streptosporangiaceae bacterium]|jgi:drug/metabolite transporter (DMT)-like permease|nr:DMT family transporter [Streptosporangiaceae bacterium]